MIKIIFIVSWIIGTLFARYIPVKSMDVVTRRELKYEITGLHYQGDRLNIQGWGFMYMRQHFTNSSTHDIYVALENETETKTYKASLLPVDQTQLLKYGNVPRCMETQLNQHAMTCYYDYVNVGFSVSVPLSDLSVQKTYTMYLIIYGKRLNEYQKIPLYYPLQNSIITKVGDYEYHSISNLKDTEITVISAHVYARSGPSTEYPVYRLGSNCSDSALNRAFFRENTTYLNIHDRYFDGTNTYFMVSADPSVCYLSRRRIIEGKTVKPVWIASGFVQYGGTPLIITSKLINTAPWIEIIHPTIEQGEYFDYSLYIRAFDEQEGELTHKIKVLSNPYSDKPGTYSLVFEVTDKYGFVSTDIMYVTVTEPLNTNPMILAEDKVIYRFSDFNELDNVYAYDVEDGDLSHQIIVNGNVDKSRRGEYILCYQVYDSHGAQVQRCIIVQVIDHIYKKTRFISNNTKNTAKYPWQYLMNILERETGNSVPYLIKTINK